MSRGGRICRSAGAQPIKRSHAQEAVIHHHQFAMQLTDMNELNPYIPEGARRLFELGGTGHVAGGIAGAIELRVDINLDLTPRRLACRRASRIPVRSIVEIII